MSYRNAMVLTAAAASVNGSDQDSSNACGAIVVIDITAITGTSPTAVFTLQGKDVVSGKYYTILASASLTATGTTVLRVHHGLTAAANAVAVDVLPDAFRVICTIGGTTPAVTATVGVHLIR
jgi:hypothetical protein